MDGARELFETLELLFYENLASSRMKGNAKRKDKDSMGAAISQSRLLCSVVSAIAKLATRHRELSPRARVCLSKVCSKADSHLNPLPSGSHSPLLRDCFHSYMFDTIECLSTLDTI
ncbi:hypothetical protein M758_UG097700 [Ceratodon purpureus]|nr:hypothetical protein M758_UG097700 [Ceratodon purpureus]